ncbi:MAG: cytochrome c, partial [Acidobacteriota bacterium]
MAEKARYGKIALVLLSCVFAVGLAGNTWRIQLAGSAQAAGQAASNAKAVFEQYCVQCHSGTAAKAGVNLASLTARNSFGESFQQWEKVASVLEQKTMPPKSMPQPTDAERAQAVAWIRSELNAYATKHDGDPGPVTVRRLTSGE